MPTEDRNFDNRSRVQRCLDRVNDGDAAALQELISFAYEALRAQVRAVLRGESAISTATPILHDVLADLLAADLGKLQFDGPGHFFALTSRMIRNTLQDRIRRRNAVKRGGGRTIVSLNGDDIPLELRTVDYLDLHDALEELCGFNERLWKVTECKLASMTNAEAARALGVSEKTIEKDWKFVKAWLAERLGAGDDTRTVSAGA